MNRYELTAENIKEVTTEELAKMFYPAKDEVTFQSQVYAGALRMDISDYKVEIAKKTLAQDKARYNMIVNELLSRGVKTVKRNGQYN